MPLINLRTNLKTTSDFTAPDPNLSYGHDRKDFGSSNQPYIVTPIPKGNDNAPSSPDFLLRNGYLNPINSLQDVKRISKFLNPIGQGASINGLLFTIKQGLLERQNVKVVNGFSRLFNPLQPILQAGVLSIGYHLNKQGFNVFKRGYYDGGREGYFEITRTDSLVGSSSQIGVNRLVSLFNTKQNLLATPTTDTINRIKYDISPDSNTLLSYSGGPGAILGILGKTNIRIQNPLEFKTNIPSIPNSTTFGYPIEKTPETYLAPDSANIKNVFSIPFSGYGNFSTYKNNTYKSTQTSFNRKRKGTTQVINPNLSISPDNDFDFGDDIIDFQFELLNNEGLSSPNTILNFRAYIDDFSDTFNGDWEAYRYVGRGENFYKYKGFIRDLSIGFTVPVLSRADMVNMYQKLNGLVWATAPDYSDAGLMRGTLVKLTMGDYLRNSISIIKSITFTPIMEMGFDINRNEDGTKIPFGNDLYTGQLPKGIRVQCNMIPLNQGVEGKVDLGEGISEEKTLYYSIQRGEAFVGNRTHVIKDRNLITRQYNETIATREEFENSFSPTNPDYSPLMNNVDTPLPPPGPSFQGTFQEPDVNDILFTK